MIHVIRTAAKADILRLVRYCPLEAPSTDIAARSLKAADKSIGSTCGMPEIGAPKLFENRILSGQHSWAVNGFEVILNFYIVQLDTLCVVRVLQRKLDTKNILERELDDEAHP